MNNYVITIDLNKLSKEHNKNINKEKLISKLEKYYDINNYIFNKNIEKIKPLLIEKFDININYDLVVLNPISLQSLTDHNEKIIKYDKGIILFDIGMLNDDKIINNIITYTYQNYKNITISKLYDNYILCFSEKLNIIKNDIEDIKNIKNNLITLFINDINKLILSQKITNIKNVLQSKLMLDKLNFDISYSGLVIDNIYMKYYSNGNITINNDLTNYEKILKQDLESSNYEVNYNLFNNDKELNNSKHVEYLNMFKYYNLFFNKIQNKLRHEFGEIKKRTVEENNKENNKENNIMIADIFDINKLNEIYIKYENSKQYLIFKMNDVLDDKILIVSDIENKMKSKNEFINDTIIFINELMKRKIKKLIRLFNYNQYNINGNY